METPFRFDWYQRPDAIVISIYIKNVISNTVRVDFEQNQVQS